MNFNQHSWSRRGALAFQRDCIRDVENDVWRYPEFGFAQWLPGLMLTDRDDLVVYEVWTLDGMEEFSVTGISEIISGRRPRFDMIAVDESQAVWFLSDAVRDSPLWPEAQDYGLDGQSWSSADVDRISEALVKTGRVSILGDAEWQFAMLLPIAFGEAIDGEAHAAEQGRALVDYGRSCGVFVAGLIVHLDYLQFALRSKGVIGSWFVGQMTISGTLWETETLREFGDYLWYPGAGETRLDVALRAIDLVAEIATGVRIGLSARARARGRRALNRIVPRWKSSELSSVFEPVRYCFGEDMVARLVAMETQDQK